LVVAQLARWVSFHTVVAAAPAAPLTDPSRYPSTIELEAAGADVHLDATAPLLACSLMLGR
jgi:hypothetical protein